MTSFGGVGGGTNPAGERADEPRDVPTEWFYPASSERDYGDAGRKYLADLKRHSSNPLLVAAVEAVEAEMMPATHDRDDRPMHPAEAEDPERWGRWQAAVASSMPGWRLADCIELANSEQSDLRAVVEGLRTQLATSQIGLEECERQYQAQVAKVWAEMNRTEAAEAKAAALQVRVDAVKALCDEVEADPRNENSIWTSHLRRVLDPEPDRLCADGACTKPAVDGSAYCAFDQSRNDRTPKGLG